MKQVLVIFLGAVCLFGCSTSECVECRQNGGSINGETFPPQKWELCNDGSITPNGEILTPAEWELFIEQVNNISNTYECYP